MKILFGKTEREFYERIISSAKSDSKVESLEREIDRLSERIEKIQKEWSWERERADRAVDSLLASKGMAPVMPDPQPSGLDSPELFREDPKDVDKILKEMGLARGSA